MSIGTGHAWRLALGAVLLFALLFLCPSGASAGPEPEADLPPCAGESSATASASSADRFDSTGDGVDLYVSPTSGTPTPVTPTPTGPTLRAPTLATPTLTATIAGTSWCMYFPLVHSHWSPRPEDCTELLTNGNFESGALAPWSSDRSAGLGTGRDSAYGGWLGGQNNTTGALAQWITIPAGADAVRWEFWWMAEVMSLQPSDFMHIVIQDAAGGEEQVLVIYRADRALNQWRQETVDLSAYAGQVCRVTFRAYTYFIHPARFLVDDVSVRACFRP